MVYAILTAVSLVLFFGFVGLTFLEARHGVRMLAPVRTSFDRFAARAFSAMSHVDLGAFLFRLLRDLLVRLTHDVAHGTLVAVRFVERILTRAVRSIRAKNAPAVSTGERGTSRFVRTIVYFKQTLRRSRRTPNASPEGEDGVG